MLGYRPEEFHPDISSWNLMVHPDDLPAMQAALAEHLSGRAPFRQPGLGLRCGHHYHNDDHFAAFLCGDARSLQMAALAGERSDRALSDRGLRLLFSEHLEGCGWRLVPAIGRRPGLLYGGLPVAEARVAKASPGGWPVPDGSGRMDKRLPGRASLACQEHAWRQWTAAASWRTGATTGCFRSSSAICTALSAAPLRSWSPATQKQRPFSSAQSWRSRPTAQLYLPDW